MKPYTPQQVLIMEIALQLAQLSGDLELELAAMNGLSIARFQAYLRKKGD